MVDESEYRALLLTNNKQKPRTFSGTIELAFASGLESIALTDKNPKSKKPKNPTPFEQDSYQRPVYKSEEPIIEELDPNDELTSNFDLIQIKKPCLDDEFNSRGQDYLELKITISQGFYSHISLAA